MTRLPAHRAQRHAEIRARLLAEAQRRFPDHEPGGWDPTRELAGSGAAPGVDFGRGLLDAFALGLHVLWTYQEAWAAEGFLPLAELEPSVNQLLRAIGHQPSPGTAALGLQHIRCVEGTTGLLPAGFKLSSPARGDEPSATFETLHALRLDPALNELRAWQPASASSSSSSSSDAPDSAGGLEQGDTSDVPRLAPAGAALADRLAAGAGGDLAARRAARARVELRRLADTLRQLREAGGEACGGVLENLCEQLCAAQAAAASAPVRPGTLSESQQLARRQLDRLASSDALGNLEQALARAPGESDAQYRARLDAMAQFLDRFVAGLMRDARDQVILLRGPRAFARLDRAARGSSGPALLGSAAPGTDSLLLLLLRDGRISPGPVPMLRPGAWLVIGEELERVDDEGRPVRERVYREGVRVASCSEEQVAGVPGPFTRVTFEPPLRRAYRLDRVFVLGNIARVSQGQRLEELLRVSLDGRTLELSEGPLTWLPAPRDAGGGRPEVRVWIGPDEWRRTEHLLTAGPSERVFAVEPLASGRTRLRFGDGTNGALVPSEASVRVRYRVGLGPEGNRAALRVDGLADAHPAAESTFNPLPLAGGTPPEDPRAARTLAPAALRAMDRAVSLADVRALALTFGGVQRAEVHRGARRGELIVTVSGAGARALEDRGALAEFLQARVAPGLHIVVREARPVEVCADVLLRVAPGADALAVISSARVRLGADDPEPAAPPGLLHPERTRIDGDLRLSDLYAALQGIPGLSSCLVRRLYRRRAGADGSRLLARPARGPSEVVRAAADERLVWAPARAGQDGLVLELEQERDR